MSFPIRAVLLTLVSLLPVACAAPSTHELAAQDAWLADVAWLADDERQGRDTGTPELFETAEYVAEAFERAGLQPLDGESFLQHFTVPGRRQLLDGNLLVAGETALRLRRDWIPLQTALRGSAEGPVVFAGYGISDPENGWDDYAGLDVEGKVALVLRGAPRADQPDSPWADGRPASEKRSFLSKTNAAFKAGAVALVVVNDPATHRPGSRADRVRDYQSLGGGGAPGASLPAAHVSAAAGERLFAEWGLDLGALQTELDARGAPDGFPIEGATLRLVVAAERTVIGTVNVLGWLPGNDPTVADEHVLIGAHMDHVGLGEVAGSRGGLAARGQIHNGADDNASGTAGLILAARALAARRHELRRGVVFAAWSGEEWGLLGSRHYAAEPPRPLAGLVAAINMDMIGRSGDGSVTVEGMGSAPGLTELVTAANAELPAPLQLKLSATASPNSDHASFHEKQVPVVNFFTGLHDDYHMPSDDLEKVDATHGAAISMLAANVAARLSGLSARPAFTPPPAARPVAGADPHAAAAPGDAPVIAYRVVLGTSPDMAYDREDGVRISGVRAGTPAEAAGLAAGDLITALDGRVIRNLQDYSVLLFSRRPGDVITLTIRRGESTLELQATLGGQPVDG